MDTPPTVDVASAEDVYCETRARRYVGDERTRVVCDREVEGWLKAERSAAREELETRLTAIRALMLHVQDNLELAIARLEKAVAERPTPALHAADVPELVAKATVVHSLWRGYASQEMYGEMLMDGMDRCDFDVFEEAMGGMNDALRPFEPPE